MKPRYIPWLQTSNYVMKDFLVSKLVDHDIHVGWTRYLSSTYQRD